MSLGFRIWSIDKRIEGCVDEETGEILKEELLEELERNKEELLEDAALTIKNLNAELDALRNEIKQMTERKQRAERNIDTLKKVLKESLNGEKIKTPRVQVTYRKSQSVNILNLDKIPSKFIKIKKEADKTAIKKALKAGEVEGAEVIQNTSIIIK